MKYYNNPLNIRTGENWLGLVPIPSQDKFCEFTDLCYCVRAWLKIFNTYQTRFSLTIPNLVSNYAPASDRNNVVSYCNFLYVGRSNDLFKDVKFSPYMRFFKSRPLELYVLCRRMCQIESNFDLSMSDFDNGYEAFMNY